MTQNEIIILNFEEIRRRSINLWSGIPPENYFWRPDIDAMNCLEMVRQVLEGEHIYHRIVEKGGDLDNFISPWEGKRYTDLEAELAFAESFRKSFIETIKQFSPDDFLTIEIIRQEKGQSR
ncbi:MAG: DinB family protein, partial [Blastocatellia bacterium]|nr:DinB family protein [Blastocatellia bacterium]